MLVTLPVNRINENNYFDIALVYMMIYWYCVVVVFVTVDVFVYTNSFK